MFDTFSVYMGLFTLLGFSYFQYCSIYSPQYLSLLEQEGEKERTKIPIKNKWILAGTFCLVVFLIYFTVWMPYKVNALGLKYYISFRKGQLDQAQEYLEQACKNSSPFANFPVRKRAGWRLLKFLDGVEKVENPNPDFVDFYNESLSKKSEKIIVMVTLNFPQPLSSKKRILMLINLYLLLFSRFLFSFFFFLSNLIVVGSLNEL